MNTKAFKNYHLETDEDNILWVSIDRQGSPVNTIDLEVCAELDALVDQIAQDKPAGVIFTSAKKKGFIAGADIKQFTHVKTKEEAYELIRPAQIVLDKLEALPMPTVAMINGFCLGGGFEFALACRYRVADDLSGTRIGLPETKLGIHPGWGGTIRLPKLVGAIEAMKMILPGAAYPSEKAAKIGMIDAAVPTRELKRAARYFVMKKPAPGAPKGIPAKLSNSDLARPLLAKQFYKQLAAKHVSKDHYPAPFAVIAQWVKDGCKGDDAMDNEAKSIANMMVTDTAKNLVRVFFLQEKMKGLAKGIKFKSEHVHVVGAGAMGGDIAAWCALRGYYVTLQDRSPESIAPAFKRAYKLFKKKLREPRLVQTAMDRLQPDADGLGVVRADVIIEAIFESLEAKQQLFKELEAKAKPDAILASNTSSIPLEDIAQSLKDPSRLVGIHFFNPVPKMPLVEIVRGKATQQEVCDKATAFVAQIGRLPLPVASSPGFLVNRILMPYLMEAMQLFEEGVSPEAIDKAALQFGMPMGPITLADRVGLDICYHVAENLCEHYGGKVPERLKTMVDNGQLGVKSGKGFYTYNKGKKVKKEQQSTTTRMLDICDRMILRMVNEAVACLHEKVIDDQDLLDAGMIFGTGFAPFRGGPINYAKTRGVASVVKDLERFAQQYGDRFKPFAGWELLQSNESGNGSAQLGKEAPKPAKAAKKASAAAKKKTAMGEPKSPPTQH